MDILEAVRIIRTYNAWRRGDEDIPMPDPTSIVIALDTICDHIITDDGKTPPPPPTLCISAEANPLLRCEHQCDGCRNNGLGR